MPVRMPVRQPAGPEAGPRGSPASAGRLLPDIIELAAHRAHLGGAALRPPSGVFDGPAAGVRDPYGVLLDALHRVPRVAAAHRPLTRLPAVPHLRLAERAELDNKLKKDIKLAIRQGASPRHVPAFIIAVPDIPRTRSGKITELAVRDIIHQRPVKNIEALANAEALAYFENLPELQT